MEVRRFELTSVIHSTIKMRLNKFRFIKPSAATQRSRIPSALAGVAAWLFMARVWKGW